MIMLAWGKNTRDSGNASQPYSFARAPKKAIAEARKKVATAINADPEEIFFTSGGTESDNWAIKGIAFSCVQKKKTITSEIEHHAILNACGALEGLGYPVSYIKPDKEGIISPQMLESVIDDNTGLVSIMFSNNEIGTIEPIKELAAVAHQHGSLFHTDAVQAVGHISIDVKELGVDMLSASAHKFNGPKGIGFLYVKKGTQIKPFNDGGSQEFGMRAGTENVASIVGMATALEKNANLIDQNEKYLLQLEARLVNILDRSGIDYVRNGAAKHVPGNMSLSFNGKDGEALLHRLDLQGICVSTGSACDSKNTQISHVLKAIELEEKYAKGTIRVSLGKDNTKEDVDKIGNVLLSMLSE